MQVYDTKMQSQLSLQKSNMTKNCSIRFPSFITVASQQIPELILWTFIAHAKRAVECYTQGNTPLIFDKA